MINDKKSIKKIIGLILAQNMVTYYGIEAEVFSIFDM